MPRAGAVPAGGSPYRARPTGCDGRERNTPPSRRRKGGAGTFLNGFQRPAARVWITELAQATARQTAVFGDGIMEPMNPVRVVFMGTPEIAVPVLEAVLGLGSRWPVVGVYAAPDRPAGRGREVRSAPVKAFAEKRGLGVLSPTRLGAPEEVERFEALRADLVVLAAYGLLLPKPFLDGPRFGAVNVHPSLLPRHRGAAPVAATILAGDEATGASVIVMDEGLDTGPLLARSEPVVLDGTERTPGLTARLFALGAELLTDVLPRYVAGDAVPQPQVAEGATLVKRLSKADGDLDWSQPASQLERQVRAYDPWPGSATTWRGQRLEVLDAGVAPGGGTPGTVVELDGAVGVGTGDGLLVLRSVRLAGRPATTAEEFVRGHRELVGATLPS